MSTIFVSIAAYNENDLYRTVETMFTKATKPYNVYAGV
jgi:hypothetical protein